MFGAGKRLRYLAEDETRIGLKTQTGKVITSFGVKPVAPVRWGRANFLIYGVVEPLSGWHFAAEYPHLDTENFQQFIDALSLQLGAVFRGEPFAPETTAEDIAVIQLDQAGAHMTSALRWAENLIPICQPAHSPELNPPIASVAVYQGSA